MISTTATRQSPSNGIEYASKLQKTAKVLLG